MIQVYDINTAQLRELGSCNYLDSQIRDDFQCDQDCYSQYMDPTNDNHSNTCTHDYHHMVQNIQDLTYNTQQNKLHSLEEHASSFTDDTDTHCDFSISDHTSDTENVNETHTDFMPKYPTIHPQRKHVYRDTFGNAHMILITETYLYSETNILHYYNKNYKTHIGIYMTQ